MSILGNNWKINLDKTDIDHIEFLNKIFIPLEFNIINIDIIKDNKKIESLELFQKNLIRRKYINKIGNLLTSNIRHYINSAIIQLLLIKTIYNKRINKMTH